MPWLSWTRDEELALCCYPNSQDGKKWSKKPPLPESKTMILEGIYQACVHWDLTLVTSFQSVWKRNLKTECLSAESATENAKTCTVKSIK